MDDEMLPRLPAEIGKERFEMDTGPIRICLRFVGEKRSIINTIGGTAL
jgi:hypothetical protein